VSRARPVERALGAGKRPRRGRTESKPRPRAAALACAVNATVDSVAFPAARSRDPLAMRRLEQRKEEAPARADDSLAGGSATHLSGNH